MNKQRLKNEMLNSEYKKRAMKELENISTKELINLLQEVGSTRVDDGKNEESDFEGDVENVDILNARIAHAVLKEQSK